MELGVLVRLNPDMCRDSGGGFVGAISAGRERNEVGSSIVP